MQSQQLYSFLSIVRSKQWLPLLFPFSSQNTQKIGTIDVYIAANFIPSLNDFKEAASEELNNILIKRPSVKPLLIMKSNDSSDKSGVTASKEVQNASQKMEHNNIFKVIHNKDDPLKITVVQDRCTNNFSSLPPKSIYVNVNLSLNTSTPNTMALNKSRPQPITSSVESILHEKNTSSTIVSEKVLQKFNELSERNVKMPSIIGNDTDKTASKYLSQISVDIRKSNEKKKSDKKSLNRANPKSSKNKISRRPVVAKNTIILKPRLEKKFERLPLSVQDIYKTMHIKDCFVVLNKISSRRNKKKLKKTRKTDPDDKRCHNKEISTNNAPDNGVKQYPENIFFKNYSQGFKENISLTHTEFTDVELLAILQGEEEQSNSTKCQKSGSNCDQMILPNLTDGKSKHYKSLHNNKAPECKNLPKLDVKRHQINGNENHRRKNLSATTLTSPENLTKSATKVAESELAVCPSSINITNSKGVQIRSVNSIEIKKPQGNDVDKLFSKCQSIAPSAKKENRNEKFLISDYQEDKKLLNTISSKTTSEDKGSIVITINSENNDSLMIDNGEPAAKKLKQVTYDRKIRKRFPPGLKYLKPKYGFYSCYSCCLKFNVYEKWKRHFNEQTLCPNRSLTFSELEGGELDLNCNHKCSKLVTGNES